MQFVEIPQAHANLDLGLSVEKIECIMLQLQGHPQMTSLDFDSPRPHNF